MQHSTANMSGKVRDPDWDTSRRGNAKQPPREDTDPEWVPSLQAIVGETKDTDPERVPSLLTVAGETKETDPERVASIRAKQGGTVARHRPRSGRHPPKLESDKCDTRTQNKQQCKKS